MMRPERGAVALVLIVCWLLSSAWLPGSVARPAPGASPDLLIPMQVAKLVASDSVAQDKFGWSAALSQNVIVVGMPKLITGTSTLPAAYVFARNPDGSNQWGDQHKLRDPLNAPDDRFGCSAAVSGDTAVIGASRATVFGKQQAGAAYVFKQDGFGNWGPPATLSAANGDTQDFFGTAVSLDGNTIVAGAPWADVNHRQDGGAAYVFDRDDLGNWTEAATITATNVFTQDFFGTAVSLDGDTLVVGAYGDNIGDQANSGSAYVFYRDRGGPDVWGLVKKLTVASGQRYDDFGISVSLDGDTLVVGAHQPGNSQAIPAQLPGPGAAYVFERNTGGADQWGQVAKLTASDGAVEDWFGYSVSLSGDSIVAGAPYEEVGGNIRQGAAYVFSRDEGGVDQWGQTTRLVSNDGVTLDAFGSSVSTTGDTFLVGAPYANIGSDLNRGAAYVFVHGYSVSGRVTDGSGNGISGVTISTGAGQSATTDSTGSYTLTGIVAGDYTLTPSKLWHIFSPPSLPVTVSGADVPGQDFVGVSIPVTETYLPIVER